MKKILLLILAVSMCLGLVSCSTPGSGATDTGEDATEDTTDNAGGPGFEPPDPNKVVTQAFPYGTTTCDLAELLGGTDHQVLDENGQELDSANVELAVGANTFYINYKVAGIDRVCEANIARRSGHRVVFNSNGGSYIDTKYVDDGGVISDLSVIPTRDRYTFEGWYNEKGQKVTLSSTPIKADTTFIARWNGPNVYATPDKTSVVYETSSAALNINWRDYANAFETRPIDVMCTLKNLDTNVEYAVRVTKYSASFVGVSPTGASISQGAGNWTVKITNLPKDANYSFVMDDLTDGKYTTIQSGTTVTNTMKKYEPRFDDSAALMTMNAHFYDIAGNVVILKGVVPVNVNASDFASNASMDALKRMQQEGCNAIRVTMPLGETAGYATEGKKEIYVSRMKGVVERTADLGMYCIVDWGVMMKGDDAKVEADYLGRWLPLAQEFFGNMSASYANNPYILYELANEPTLSLSDSEGWEQYFRPWYEKIITVIRGNDPDGVIIAAPNMHARRLSDARQAKGDDPIDKPFDTAMSFNIAYTFHCYAYTTTYNIDYSSARKSSGGASKYAWRLCDAVANGLVVVITEFSPANGAISSENPFDSIGLDADYIEADKYMKFILENDVNYMMFRYGAVTAKNATVDPDEPGKKGIQSQRMFNYGYADEVERGTWTYDMFTECGKWFYDSALGTTGFIKSVDFDACYKYN